MTLRYRYNEQHQPPAPMIVVRVVSPSGTESDGIPALLDSGADRTVIPDGLANKLNLQRGREVEIGGVGGMVTKMTSYFVAIRIHDFDPVEIEGLVSNW